MLPTGVFLTNRKGYPVLSTRHQAALKALVARHGAQVMVSGPPAGGAARGLKPYQQCVGAAPLRASLRARARARRRLAPAARAHRASGRPEV